MTIIAVLFPWLSFFLRGKILHGIICLILQITLIGWLRGGGGGGGSLLDGRNKARIKSLDQN